MAKAAAAAEREFIVNKDIPVAPDHPNPRSGERLYETCDRGEGLSAVLRKAGIEE